MLTMVLCGVVLFPNNQLLRFFFVFSFLNRTEDCVVVFKYDAYRLLFLHLAADFIPRTKRERIVNKNFSIRILSFTPWKLTSVRVQKTEINLK